MTVLNKHHGNIPENAIYIGRGSKWGNPFPLHKDTNREEVLEKYKKYLTQMIQTNQYTLEDLASLHNQDLVCFCAPKLCHGYPLEKAAKWAWERLNK